MLLSCMQLKGNRKTYHLYWYITIPALVAVLLTIMACNSYPYLLRSPLNKFHCNTRPVVNSTPENKSLSPPDVSPEEQPSTSQLHSNESGGKTELVTYFVQTVAWSRDSQSTGRPSWKMRVNCLFLASCSTTKKQGISRTPDGKCAVLIYASVNSVFYEILEKM
jgi:hypothetical protein